MTPAGWRRVHLSDVAEQRIEKVVPAETDRRPYVALEHLGPGGTALLGWADAGSANSTKTVFHAGDVLFGKLRPYLRKAARAPFDGLCSTDILPLFGKSPLDTCYLAQLAQWPPLQQHAVATSSGTKMPRTSWPQLGTFEFSLPPLPEQRKVAAILSSMDDAIEKTQAVIDQVQVVKRGVMQELLTRGLPGRHTRFKQTEIGRIPEEWQLKRLSEVASVQTGLAKNKANAGPLSVSYLRVANVQDGFMDLAEVKAVEVNPNALTRFALRPGDVLFTEGGDADKLGRGAVWNGEIEPCLHQNHVFVARPLGNIRPMFLSLYRGSARGRSYFLNCSKQTTNLASMNCTQLKNLPLPMPGLDEQDRIVECLGAFDDRLSQEDDCLKELGHLKSALMSILLTGELRVTPDADAACPPLPRDGTTALRGDQRSRSVTGPFLIR